MMQQYIQNLMASRTATHMMHLASKSYAQHMALGHFYDGISDLLDDLAETYQGIYGLIEWEVGSYVFGTTDPIGYLKGLREKGIAQRAELEADTNLQNIIDEITSLIDQTIYKLTFLV